MGDIGDHFNDLREARRQRRAEKGKPCLRCPEVQPKRIPTILLPGQRCKVCGFRDPRQRGDG